MICGNTNALARYEREEEEYTERYERALAFAQDELSPKFAAFDKLVHQLKELEEGFSKLSAYSGPSSRLGDLCAGLGGGLADVIHGLGQELPAGNTLQARLDSLWDSECERYAEQLLEIGDF